MIKWRRDEKGLKILHFHLYGHFKSTWQVAKCCCKEIRHQQMTNPYNVYEKSTYRKVSQMRGWDSGGDFAVSFGCESCFSSETQSFCVAQSKSVPNMVVIMRIFRKKWLRSSIGRSQGVRIPASLSEWGGEPVYTTPPPTWGRADGRHDRPACPRPPTSTMTLSPIDKLLVAGDNETRDGGRSPEHLLPVLNIIRHIYFIISPSLARLRFIIHHIYYGGASPIWLK